MNGSTAEHGSRHRSLVRRTSAGAGGALVALLALLTAMLVTVPGAAAAEPARATAPHGQATNPELDWMGSTVAAHEGRSAGSGNAVVPNVTQTLGSTSATTRARSTGRRVSNHGPVRIHEGDRGHDLP